MQLRPEEALPLDPVEFTFAVEMLFSDTTNWRSPKVVVLHDGDKPVMVEKAAVEIIAKMREHKWPRLKLESFFIRLVAHSHLVRSDAVCRHFPFPEFEDYDRKMGASLELAATFPVTPRWRFDQPKFLAAMDALLRGRENDPACPPVLRSRQG